jgi:acetyl-CoA carboxylase carboxyltransferase component
MRDARILLSYLPSNASEGALVSAAADSINRTLGNVSFGEDVRNAVAAIADNSVFTEITRDFAPEMFTAFATLGGVRCGILGNRTLGGGSVIGAEEARKAARFVSFCDAFAIPLITLVDTDGFAFCSEANNTPYATCLSSLAMAYAKAKTAKITVVLGRAIGGAFTILGSKSVGADVVYALSSAEIGALPTDASVAFAWNGLVSENITREELESEWRASLASPVAAACRGEIDDIITVDEMRQKILSALYMLTSKTLGVSKRHPILPL